LSRWKIYCEKCIGSIETKGCYNWLVETAMDPLSIPRQNFVAWLESFKDRQKIRRGRTTGPICVYASIPMRVEIICSLNVNMPRTFGAKNWKNATSPHKSVFGTKNWDEQRKICRKTFFLSMLLRISRCSHLYFTWKKRNFRWPALQTFYFHSFVNTILLMVKMG
jgi:hypothetical protein